MSLCIVCRSIPFRKLITRGAEAVVNDGFRFNAAGRTSSTASDDMSWNMRRCTVPEIVSRAKTCPLCANILLTARNHRWFLLAEGKYIRWEEAKAAISRNLMVWMELPDWGSRCDRFQFSLGSPRRSKTFWLEFELRKTVGNLNVC
jgi:hypothetical protein